MSEEELEASVALMKRLGIVDSGAAATLGIGTMDAGRIRDFHAQMVQAGLYRAGDVDLDKVATLRFVNRKVGLQSLPAPVSPAAQ
jgi:NitT/TauT family transport system substrate-binding protein